MKILEYFRSAWRDAMAAVESERDRALDQRIFKSLCAVGDLRRRIETAGFTPAERAEQLAKLDDAERTFQLERAAIRLRAAARKAEASWRAQAQGRAR